MALISVITNDGMSRSIQAQANRGFFIKVKSFKVSEEIGEMSPSRTEAEMLPTWYSGPISSGSRIDSNTIQVVLTIPPSQASESKNVKELYLMGEDENGAEYLLAIAQPNPYAIYAVDGSLTFRLQMQVRNLNIGDTFQFIYTQATEVSEHNSNVDAHPSILEKMKHAGVFSQEIQRKWVGQHFDAFVGALKVKADVQDKNIVYWDTAVGKYGKAINGLTDAQYAVGMYNSSLEMVSMGGVVEYAHSYAPYTNLYLSNDVEGAIVDTYTTKLIGYALPDNKIFLNIQDLVKYGSVVGGGGGAGSFIPSMGVIAPSQEQVDGIDLLGFSKEGEQHIFFNWKIPSGYVKGNRLSLLGGAFYCQNVDAGKVLIKAETVLIKKNLHVLGSALVSHVSTNVEVNTPAVMGKQGQLGAIDLTDENGKINNVDVEEGDILKIKVFRDVENETTSVDDIVLIPSHCFEPKKILS